MVRLFNILDYWAQLAQPVWRSWHMHRGELPYRARRAPRLWRITVSRPAGTETDSLRRSSGSGISCFVSPAPIRFVAGRQIETAIECIPSDHPPPKGGVGIKLIVRIERNKLGMVSAAPSRKPVFTRVARLFSCQRLHEISSG